MCRQRMAPGDGMLWAISYVCQLFELQAIQLKMGEKSILYALPYHIVMLYKVHRGALHKINKLGAVDAFIRVQRDTSFDE